MAARKVTTRTDLTTAVSKIDSSLTAATAAGKAIAGAEHKAEQSAAARRTAYAKHAPTITAYVMAGGKASTLAAAIAGVSATKAQRDAKAQAAFQAMEKRIQRWDTAGRLIASHPVKDDEVRDAMVKLANGLTRDEATALANSAKWTPAATDTVANVRKYTGTKPGNKPRNKPRNKPGKPGNKPGNKPDPKAETKAAVGAFLDAVKVLTDNQQHLDAATRRTINAAWQSFTDAAENYGGGVILAMVEEKLKKGA